MTHNELLLIICGVFILYYSFFRTKIKCLECMNELKAFSYRELGLSWLLGRLACFLYDIVTEDTVNYSVELLFLAPAFYYLASEPKYFCRHCMTGVPFDRVEVVK